MILNRNDEQGKPLSRLLARERNVFGPAAALIE